CPSCPAGTYTSTTRSDGSPNILLLRAELSIATRVTEPIGPKNLRIWPTLPSTSSACRAVSRASHQAIGAGIEPAIGYAASHRPRPNLSAAPRSRLLRIPVRLTPPVVEDDIRESDAANRAEPSR